MLNPAHKTAPITHGFYNGIQKFMLFLVLLLCTTLAGSLYLSFLSQKSANQLQHSWQHSNNEIHAKLQQLYTLQTQLGYGAFIHHFKNVVLRQDPILLATLEQDYQQAQKAIEQYRHFELSKQEHTWLQTIEHTLAEYNAKRPIIKQALEHSPRLSSEQIDQQVKVDDSAALDALTQLQKHVHTDYQLNNQLIDAQLQHVRAQQQWVIIASLALTLLTGFIVFILFKLVNKSQRLFDKHSEDSLLYQSTINSINDGFVMINKQGQIEAINQATQDLFGYTKEELIGQNITILMPEGHHKDKHDSYLQNATGEYKRVLYKDRQLFARHKDGHLIPSEITVTPLTLNASSKYLGVVRDISERFELLQRIAANAQLYRETFELAAVGIAHISLDGHWLRANQTLQKILGYDEAQLQNLEHQQIIHPDDINNDQQEQQQLREGYIDKYSIEKRYVRQDGTPIWTEQSIALLRDADQSPKYFIAVIEDISDRKSMTERLKHMAAKDFLSGLYNRRTFMEEAARLLAKAIAERNCISLILLDIDHFKSINDTYGHQVGDEAIKHISQHLQHCARENDIVARYGGEEFMLVLANTSEKVAIDIAQRIRSTLMQTPLNVDELTLTLTASVGVTCSNNTVTSLEQLISRVDKAMYQAKVTGRNKVVAFSQLV